MMHPSVLWVSVVMHPKSCKLCQPRVFVMIITDPKHSAPAGQENNPGNAVRETRVCWHISLQTGCVCNCGFAVIQLTISVFYRGFY